MEIKYKVLEDKCRHRRNQARNMELTNTKQKFRSLKSTSLLYVTAEYVETIVVLVLHKASLAASWIQKLLLRVFG